VLEFEHGILELDSPSGVFFTSIGSSLAYGLGAAIPFLMTFVLPINIETWVIFVTVLASLTLIAHIGAQLGQLNMRRTLMRAFVVGALTISVSYLVGDIAF